MRLTKRLFVSLLVEQKLKSKHSVIIPLANNNELQEEFIKFKQLVLSKCEGLNEQLFQCPKQLHITICSFDTNSDYDILKARVLLKHCYQNYIKQLLNEKPLIVQIKGLGVLKGVPKRAHILYAKIDDQSNRLQTIVNCIVDEFNEFKLLNYSEIEKQIKTKLHITFMNSEFPQRIAYKDFKTLNEFGLNNGSYNGYNEYYEKIRLKREPFDVSKIVDKFKDYFFCNLVIRNIEFNQKLNFRVSNVLELLPFPNQLLLKS